MTVAYPPIPHGEAEFRRIRRTGSLYVDKTRFLRRLEDACFATLIRPRGFGKTCWVSLLETYYDRHWADRFESLFAGTDIGAEPTAERGRYVVLRFDFSAFDGALEHLDENFEEYCGQVILGAVKRHPDLFPEAVRQRILASSSASGKLHTLFLHAGYEIPLYVLVDEYDSFANTILADHGEEAYHSFAHGAGGSTYRSFFSTLKAGTEQGGVERIFITGVSPISLNGLTGGFNISRYLSLDTDFNEAFGFTEAEVRGVLEFYRDRGVFDRDVEETLATMREWCGGYRFAAEAETSVFHPGLTLQHLTRAAENRSGPDDPMEGNARMDDGKLRRLLAVACGLNWNLDLLREVVGGERMTCWLRDVFPAERLGGGGNFLPLLHCFGLLSICGEEYEKPVLGIPNRTVQRFLDDFLRDGYRRVEAQPAAVGAS